VHDVYKSLPDMRYKEFSETLKSIDVKNIDLQIKKTFKYMFLNCYKNIIKNTVKKH